LHILQCMPAFDAYLQINQGFKGFINYLNKPEFRKVGDFI